METIRKDLETKGYTVVKGVLSGEELAQGHRLFRDWYLTMKVDLSLAPHGVLKFWNVGHSRFAWYTRTRPRVLEVWCELFGTEDLKVSFDGACFLPKPRKRGNSWWLHVDQSLDVLEWQSYQGFVSYTNNKSNTLVVVPGSHLKHAELALDPNLKCNGDYCRIPETRQTESGWTYYNDPLVQVEVEAGDMVIWDSRLRHQNYSGHNEGRLVQYLSYCPSTLVPEKVKEKRESYFRLKRTTTHWVRKVKVVGLQPQVYGDKTKLINYSKLPDLVYAETEESVYLDSIINKLV